MWWKFRPKKCFWFFIKIWKPECNFLIYTCIKKYRMISITDLSPWNIRLFCAKWAGWGFKYFLNLLSKKIKYIFIINWKNLVEGSFLVFSNLSIFSNTVIYQLSNDYQSIYMFYTHYIYFTNISRISNFFLSLFEIF